MRGKWLGFGIGVAAGLAVVMRGEANTRCLDIRQETVIIPDLPPAFAGFRLLFISDLHLRRHSTRGRLVLDQVAALDPDLVCLGGDYAFTSLSQDDVLRFLAALSGRSVVGIYGNADYRLTPAMRAAWAQQVPLLQNSAHCLERQGERLWVAGVDDPHTFRDNLPRALAQVPSAAPVILLAHSPDVILHGLDPRVRLILCGHTHGGQVCLPDGRALHTNIQLPAHYAAGRHAIDHATLYVSRGVGYTRLPLRFNCPPDIALITLSGDRV